MDRYLLRWKFEYLSRPPKAGLWLQASNSNETKAWFQPKDGLTRVLIEAKNIRTREIKTLVECSGPEFMAFQWIAGAFLSPMGVKSGKPPTSIIGCKLLTTAHEYEVDVLGNVQTKPPLHLNMNYSAFGK